MSRTPHNLMRNGAPDDTDFTADILFFLILSGFIMVALLYFLGLWVTLSMFGMTMLLLAFLLTHKAVEMSDRQQDMEVFLLAPHGKTSEYRASTQWPFDSDNIG